VYVAVTDTIKMVLCICVNSPSSYSPLLRYTFLNPLLHYAPVTSSRYNLAVA
jgi:hypothetical protein